MKRLGITLQLFGFAIVLFWLMFAWAESTSGHPDPDTGNEYIHSPPTSGVTLKKPERFLNLPNIRLFCGEGFTENTDLHYHWRVTGVFQDDNGDVPHTYTLIEVICEASVVSNPEPTVVDETATNTSDPGSGETQVTDDTEVSEDMDKDADDTTEVETVVRGRQHTWNFDTDHYIGFPVIPDGVETVGDVRERFGMTHVWGYDEHNDLDNRFGAWNLNPDSVEITPHLGLSVSLRSDMVDIEGDLQYGEIVDLGVPDGQLSAGFLIGFPEVPVKYKRLSDLMQVDGVVSISRKIKIDGKTQYITNDAAIVPGMAVMVRVRNDVTLDLRGEGVPAAPMIPRNLTTSWAAQKARR